MGEDLYGDRAVVASNQVVEEPTCSLCIVGKGLSVAPKNTTSLPCPLLYTQAWARQSLLNTGFFCSVPISLNRKMKPVHILDIQVGTVLTRVMDHYPGT